MAKKSFQENYLIISDLQIPFEHSKALVFCQQLARFFNVDLEKNVICVGDETDQYFGGLWKKSPDATHTPCSELEDSRKRMRRWYRAFPYMKVATSNHGTRWWRKATEAEIPSQMMRKYEDVIEAPQSWTWHKDILVKCKHPFLVEHGDDWGGTHPHIQAAMHNGISMVLGHHHSKAGTRHIKTSRLNIWANCSGALIDFDSYAFQYAKRYKLKPCIGTTVVINGGKTAYWIPLET